MYESRLVVLSEGPHHIALYKPHNMATIGGPGVPRPTLLDLARKRYGSNIFPVHRLDRVTAGITIFARSLFAKHALDNAFKKRLVKKIYYALCEGTPSFTKLTVDSKLQKIALDKAKGPQARQTVAASGEQATTILRFLKQIGPYSLIEAQPLSGRFHQIRIHLAELHLPIVGDKLYGAKTMLPPHTIALSAVKISLPLPKGGRLDLDATHLFDLTSYLRDF